MRTTTETTPTTGRPQLHSTWLETGRDDALAGRQQATPGWIYDPARADEIANEYRVGYAMGSAERRKRNHAGRSRRSVSLYG